MTIQTHDTVPIRGHHNLWSRIKNVFKAKTGELSKQKTLSEYILLINIIVIPSL